MFHLLRQYLLLISLSLLFPAKVSAQGLYPFAEGEKVSNSAIIETKRGYISGICAMRNNEGLIIGSMFNEFGISALAFSYDPTTGKVELKHIIGMLDRRVVRRTLKKDISQWLLLLRQGKAVYINQRRGITYILKPFDDAVVE